MCMYSKFNFLGLCKPYLYLQYMYISIYLFIELFDELILMSLDRYVVVKYFSGIVCVHSSCLHLIYISV